MHTQVNGALGQLSSLCEDEYTIIVRPYAHIIRWSPTYLSVIDHHLFGELHVFEHPLQLAGKVGATLWGGNQEGINKKETR